MKIIIFLSVFITAQSLFGQHISFQNENLKAAFKKAASEKKIVFIDVYATWCGPCKLLDKKVFNDAVVSEYFNSNFINVKIDADSDEGQQVSSKYHIDEVPTMIFMNSEGKILRRLVGFYNGKQLILQGMETLAGN